MSGNKLTFTEVWKIYYIDCRFILLAQLARVPATGRKKIVCGNTREQIPLESENLIFVQTSKPLNASGRISYSQPMAGVGYFEYVRLKLTGSTRAKGFEGIATVSTGALGIAEGLEAFAKDQSQWRSKPKIERSRGQ